MKNENPKWERIRKEASKYRDKEMLYCVIFSHGVMKVGRTSSLERRLEALTSHGINTPLIEDAVFAVVPSGKKSSDAELLALERFSTEADQFGPEVFSSICRKKAEAVLRQAVSDCADSPVKEKLGPKDYHEIACSSGMYGALIYLAIEKARNAGMNKRADELQHILQTASPDQINSMMQDLGADRS